MSPIESAVREVADAQRDYEDALARRNRAVAVARRLRPSLGKFAVKMFSELGDSWSAERQVSGPFEPFFSSETHGSAGRAATTIVDQLDTIPTHP